MSFKSQALILVIFGACCLVGAQQQQQNSDGQLVRDNTNNNNERVDKLSSPAGDPYWKPQSQPNPQQLQIPIIDYYLDQESLDSLLEPTSGSEGSLYQLTTGFGPQFPPSSRNYHSLINDYKQSYLLSNPMREVRAFKPKLMSTARGFGKRSEWGMRLPQQQLSWNHQYPLTKLVAGKLATRLGN